jgi:hypothetical protein
VNVRYSYLGETTIEVVIDGDCVEVNLLPPGPVPVPAPAPLTPDPAPVAAPMDAQEAILAAPLSEGVLCTAEAPPTRKRRTLMGVIRAGWVLVFMAVGEGLTYLIDNLTGLGLPQGTSTAVGAVLYGVKRAAFPNTTL